MKESLPRIHILVVGPGLGRSENVMKAVVEIINEAKAKDTQYACYLLLFPFFHIFLLRLVIDADGLWVLANNPQLVMGYAK
jgi:ATP-dependent NAD(P)H-hydrate dehydratase